jgi:uncharacterized cofD-like protein
VNEVETATELQEVLNLDPSGPAVVGLGGGHGLEQVLLGVQSYAGKVAAIVTVADDGGSSGRLTRAYDILPPGDMRRCLLALAPEPSLWSEMFEFRFDTGDVAGHSLGNMLLAAMSELFGDFETAVNVAGQALGVIGDVIPASPRSLGLQAIIDGELVEGQAQISSRRGRVEELRLLPPEEAMANPRALEAIGKADQIVIGPGSLFTSVISATMVPGIAEAINEAPGQVIYVCNLTTQDGESLHMSAAEHCRMLLEFTGLGPGITALVHVGGAESFPPTAEPVPVSEVEIKELGMEVVTADLLERGVAWPQHDPFRLGNELRKLWQEAGP